MKQSLTALFIFLFISSCSSLKSLPDKTVDHRYSNLNFEPEEIAQETIPNFKITVEPIDASSLNALSTNAAMRVGDYEREIIDSYYELTNDENLSSNGKRVVEELIRLTELTKEQISSNSISTSLGYDLIYRMWGNTDQSKDGSEVNVLVNKGNPSFNPYYIANNYMSVFKIEMNNKSDQVQSLDFENFQISSGSEILYPRSTEYFEETLQSNLKRENAFRFNFPETLNIAPNQAVIKYLATPPINSQEESLSVQYITTDYEVTNFNFSQDLFQNNKEIELKNFIIHRSFFNTLMTNTYNFYFSVEFSSGFTFPLADNNFFVPIENLDEEIAICGAAVPNLRHSRNSAILQCKEIKPSMYQNGVLKF